MSWPRSWIVGALCVSLGLSCRAQAAALEITDTAFEARILDQARRLEVRENDRVDFGATPAMSWTRTLLEAENDGRFVQRLHWEIEEARVDDVPVSWRTFLHGPERVIQLLAPDHGWSGVHEITLRYASERAFRDAPDHVLLDWPLIQPMATTRVRRVQAALETGSVPYHAWCVSGHGLMVQQNCSIKHGTASINLMLLGALAPGDALRAWFTFPPGLVRPLAWHERAWINLQNNPWLTLPLVAFIFMLTLWFEWGREPRAPWPDPAGQVELETLPPGLAAALVEQAVSDRALMATCLDLAGRGFLRFQETPTAVGARGLTALRGRHPDDSLCVYERWFLERLFEHGKRISVPLSGHASAKNWLTDLRFEMFEELIERDYLRDNPELIRACWLAAALCLVIFGSLLLPPLVGDLFLPIVYVSAIILCIFGWWMPRATAKGARLVAFYQHWKTGRISARLRASTYPSPASSERADIYAYALGKEPVEDLQASTLLLETWLKKHAAPV